MQRFFTPYVGPNYEKGINSKKVLVLGASFYCDGGKGQGEELCEFFKDCTSTDEKKRDSSAYNDSCHYPPNKTHPLSNAPENSLIEAYENNYRAYWNFERGLVKILGSELFGITDVKDKYANYWKVWNYLAFTNYVQFFVPGEKGKYGQTQGMSCRDFKAFKETLIEWKPDVVIVWGTVINSILIEELDKNGCLLDNSKMEWKNSDYYLFHFSLPKMDNVITFINPYHPSSGPHWYNNLEKFGKYLKEALNITD